MLLLGRIGVLQELARSNAELTPASADVMPFERPEVTRRMFADELFGLAFEMHNGAGLLTERGSYNTCRTAHLIAVFDALPRSSRMTGSTSTITRSAIACGG